MDGGAAELPLCFGPQMPELPRRSMLLQCREHPIRGPRPPHRRGTRHRSGRRIQHLIDHRLDPRRSAERVDCFGAPGGALLGEGSGFVLAVSGLQRGLLSQLQHLNPARRPAMVMGERGGEFGPADLDHLSSL
jgi:hypothetical protein